MKRWTQKEKSDLKNQYAILNGDIHKILQLFPQRSYSSIKTMIRDMRLRTNKLWTGEELENLKKLFPVLNKKELEKIFKIKYRNIEYKAYEIGIKKEKNHKINNLIRDYPESFYWLGFIYTDGSIYHSKNKNSITLRIELSIKDYEHLVAFSKYIENKNEINIREKISYETKRQYCNISATDFKLLKIFCEKYDIKNNKTYFPPDNRVLESINHENLLYLLCGIIDGDGSINKYGRVDLSMHKNWDEFLTCLFNKLEINTTKQYHKNLVHFSFGKNISSMIKRKAINIPILKRKWDNV